jgi:acyl carrier protein
MIDVKEMIFALSGNEKALEDGIDLLEEGIIDSYLVIQMIYELEEKGLVLSLNDFSKDDLRTAKSIERFIEKQAGH